MALQLKISVAGKHELDWHQEGSSRFRSFLLCLGRSRFPRQLSGKESTCQAGAMGSIPESGRSGEANGNPLQYSCLGNSMERGTWRATVHGLQRVRHTLVTKQQQ